MAHGLGRQGAGSPHPHTLWGTPRSSSYLQIQIELLLRQSSPQRLSLAARKWSQVPVGWWRPAWTSDPDRQSSRRPAHAGLSLPGREPAGKHPIGRSQTGDAPCALPGPGRSGRGSRRFRGRPPRSPAGDGTAARPASPRSGPEVSGWGASSSSGLPAPGQGSPSGSPAGSRCAGLAQRARGPGSAVRAWGGGTGRTASCSRRRVPLALPELPLRLAAAAVG